MAADRAAAELPGGGEPDPSQEPETSRRAAHPRRGAAPRPVPQVLADGVRTLLADCAPAPEEVGQGAGRARARARVRARVLDLGGGTGGLSVGLAEAGHDVVVVDPSPDALAALGRRAAEAGVAGRLHGVQGDAEDLGSLVPDGSVDLVLCHGVLEVVDDPVGALASCRRALRPSGRLSLLVAGRAAAVLARVGAGNLRQAQALQGDPDGRWGPQDPLQRRFSPATAAAALHDAGFLVLRTEGVGVLGGVLPRGRTDDDPATAAALARLEQRASSDPDLLGVATALHLQAAPAPSPA